MRRREICAKNLRGECRIADYIALGFDCSVCTSFEFEPVAPIAIFKAENERDKHNAVNPSHYKQGGIECKDCIKAALGEHYIGFLIGNAIKYTYRYQHKNGVEDLKKAAVYLDWAIKELSNDEE